MTEEVEDDTAFVYLWITRRGRIYVAGSRDHDRKDRRFAYLLLPNNGG